MSRMNHIVNNLSTVIRPKINLRNFFMMCALGRIFYCKSSDEKADSDLQTSLYESHTNKPTTSDENNVDDDKLFTSYGPLQRCHAAFSIINYGFYDTKTSSNYFESCSRAQRILMDKLEHDKLDPPEYKSNTASVNLLISQRNLFSTRTEKVFHKTDLTLEEAITATAVANRSF